MQIFDLAEGTYRINYGQIAVLLNNLKKFVIKSTTVLPYYDFSYTGLIKVFECRRSESATELVFGKTVTSYLFFFFKLLLLHVRFYNYKFAAIFL